jgi:hypothetical protein
MYMGILIQSTCNYARHALCSVGPSCDPSVSIREGHNANDIHLFALLRQPAFGLRAARCRVTAQMCAQIGHPALVDVAEHDLLLPAISADGLLVRTLSDVERWISPWRHRALTFCRASSSRNAMISDL